jgi:hypothetical protein
MAMQNVSCLAVRPSLLTGVFGPLVFGWPLYALPLGVLASVLVPVFDVSDTTVSVGLFIDLSCAALGFRGLMHSTP